MVHWDPTFSQVPWSQISNNQSFAIRTNRDFPAFFLSFRKDEELDVEGFDYSDDDYDESEPGKGFGRINLMGEKGYVLVGNSVPHILSRGAPPI